MAPRQLLPDYIESHQGDVAGGGSYKMPFELSKSEHKDETWIDKARREAYLLGQGGLGFVDAARDAFGNSKVKTAETAGLSIAAGIGMAYLSRGSGFLPIATRTVGAVAAGAFLADVAVHGRSVAGALADNWRSPDNWDRNSTIVRDRLGKFAFDTTLATAFGLGGARLGYKRFEPRLSKIPPGFLEEIYPRSIRGDRQIVDWMSAFRSHYYNQVMPSGHWASNVLDARLSPAKVESSRMHLRETLEGIPTYKQYFWNVMKDFEKVSHTRLDKVGLKRFLVDRDPHSENLERLSKELRGLAVKDLSSQKTIQRVVDLQSAIKAIGHPPELVPANR